MIANSEILLFLLSNNGRILQINSAVEDILHYTPTEIQSKYLWEIFENKEKLTKHFKSPNDIEVINNNTFDLVTFYNKTIKAKLEFTPHINHNNKIDFIICNGNILSPVKQKIELSESIDFFLQKFSIMVKFFKIIRQKNLDINWKQLIFTGFMDNGKNVLGLFKTGPNLH